MEGRELKAMKASFIEPMLLERTTKLPESEYEIKWDGYRAEARPIFGQDFTKMNTW